MSDKESHTKSDFYYPKDEEQADTEQNNMSKVITHADENFGNSQEELQMFRFWTYHRKNLTTSWENFLKTSGKSMARNMSQVL